MGETNDREFTTTDDYFRVFSSLLREGIREGHLALLRAHHAAPRHTITWAGLATAVGYASGSAVNVQYGRLAKRVAHALGILEPPRGAWVFVLVEWGERDEDTGHTTFTLRSAAVRALVRLGVVTEQQMRPRRPSQLPGMGTIDHAEKRRYDPPATAETSDSRRVAYAAHRDPWALCLRAFIARRRAASPVPVRSDLSVAEEWQCQIIGNALATWLRHEGRQVIARRAALATSLEFELDPIIVFTTTTPGLVAANDLLGDSDTRVVWMSFEEFDAFEAANPRDRFACHVHVWSFFMEPPEKAFVRRALREHPVPPGSRYWQHVNGTMWARRAGQGHDDLWRWDGIEPTLVEEAFMRWVT